MKKNQLFCIIVLLLFPIKNLLCQDFLLLGENFKGISLGYSYKMQYISGMQTEESWIPIHFFHFAIVGNLHSKSSNDDSYYESGLGSIGFTIGLANQANNSKLSNNKNFYNPDGARVLAFSIEQNDLISYGIRVKYIRPFSKKTKSSNIASYINTYWYAEFDWAWFSPTLETENGAFGNYYISETDVTPMYISINLGVKIYGINIYCGLSGMDGLYKKGFYFEEPDDKKVKNNAKNTSHFMANIGIGLTLDIWKK